MKKLALSLLFLTSLLAGFTASAQRKDSGYDVGTVLINGGLTLGNFWGHGYGTVAFPAIIGSAEWSVHEWVGVGPYVGFQGYNGGATFALGARGTFHYTQFIPAIDPKMLDLYGTLHLGLNIHNIDNVIYDPATNRYKNYTSTGAVFGPVAGARWFPTKGGFGVYGEVGYGPLGFLTLGISGRF